MFLRCNWSPVPHSWGKRKLIVFFSLSDYDKLRTELGRRSQLLTSENITKPAGKIHTEKYQKAKAMIGHRLDLIHYKGKVPMEKTYKPVVNTWEEV